MTNNINPKNSYLAIFATLCMVFVSTIIMSDLLTYKLVNFFGLTATLAIVIYPLSYTVSNIITECFGKRIAINVMIIGLILEVLFDCFLTISSLIPNALNPDYAVAFSTTLGPMSTVATGAFIAALAGYITNIFIMSNLKKKKNPRSFYIRSVISSICGEVIFIIIGYSIWYYGTGLTMMTIIKLMCISLVSKVIFSIIYSFIGKYIVTFIKKFTSEIKVVCLENA